MVGTLHFFGSSGRELGPGLQVHTDTATDFCTLERSGFNALQETTNPGVAKAMEEHRCYAIFMPDHLVPHMHNLGVRYFVKRSL